MSIIARFLDRLLPEGRLTIISPDGVATTYGGGSGEASVAVRLHDRKVMFDIVRKPRLVIGEAYMDGRLTIERGSMLELLQLVVGANRFEDGGHKGKLKKGRLGKLLAVFRRNDARVSRTNVAHHYDLDDRLYELFLDADRQYSCAYFTDPGNSLEQAQSDKKAHIAAKLDLKPGQRVLDIGCGWGGMALTLNKLGGVEVLGITLSTEQLAVARRRAIEAGVAEQVRFELIDYRAVTGRFDRIVSVGMFEHVGAAHYEEFFATAKRLLTKDGVMLLHTIGKYGKANAPDPFTDKWIFPGYHVPSLSQMQAASESVRLITTDVETLRLHYAWTLQAWLTNCAAKKSEIEALYDARFYRMWEFYLAGAAVGFEYGAMNNYQVQYVRNRRSLPVTRDYQTAAELRYRAILDEAASKGPGTPSVRAPSIAS